MSGPKEGRKLLRTEYVVKGEYDGSQVYLGSTHTIVWVAKSLASAVRFDSWKPALLAASESELGRPRVVEVKVFAKANTPRPTVDELVQVLGRRVFIGNREVYFPCSADPLQTTAKALREALAPYFPSKVKP